MKEVNENFRTVIDKEGTRRLYNNIKLFEYLLVPRYEPGRDSYWFLQNLSRLIYYIYLNNFLIF